MYYDSLTKDKMQEALEFIRSNNECYRFVKEFKQAGAELLPTEDFILMEETMSWARMLEEEKIYLHHHTRIPCSEYDGQREVRCECNQ